MYRERATKISEKRNMCVKPACLPWFNKLTLISLNLIRCTLHVQLHADKRLNENEIEENKNYVEIAQLIRYNTICCMESIKCTQFAVVGSRNLNGSLCVRISKKKKTIEERERERQQRRT